jgi:hypothetical protein
VELGHTSSALSVGQLAILVPQPSDLTADVSDLLPGAGDVARQRRSSLGSAGVSPASCKAFAGNWRMRSVPSSCGLRTRGRAQLQVNLANGEQDLSPARIAVYPDGMSTYASILALVEWQKHSAPSWKADGIPARSI